MDVYDASKWGINGLTQSWAKRLRDDGIRVNALCMDAVDSEMSRFAAGDRLTPEQLATWMTPRQIGELLLGEPSFGAGFVNESGNVSV